MMRNQIIKSIKVSGLLRRGTLQQSPVISSGSIGQSVHYPAISASSCQQAQGGEPCQLLHSKMEGSVSALLQVPGNTTLPMHVPAPLPPLARGQGVLGGCAALSLLLCTATAIGKEQSQELDGSHCPFSHHLFPLPPSSGAVNARTGPWLIIHQQLLLKQPQTKLQKPLRLQDINSSQHERQM